VDLPEAGPVDGLKDEAAVGALLDCGLAGHTEHGGAVLGTVAQDGANLPRGHQRARGVVHADEPRVGRDGLQAIENGVLPA
jgi:hypothetical protein